MVMFVPGIKYQINIFRYFDGCASNIVAAQCMAIWVPSGNIVYYYYPAAAGGYYYLPVFIDRWLMGYVPATCIIIPGYPPWYFFITLVLTYFLQGIITQWRMPCVIVGEIPLYPSFAVEKSSATSAKRTYFLLKTMHKYTLLLHHVSW